jgi:ethanolamine ammonia-lyase small subunit
MLGKTDGDRNMMSNIHPRGMHPADAARKLALMVQAMLDQRTSGVKLDLSRTGSELGGEGGHAYRPPTVRERLVEVSR